MASQLTLIAKVVSACNLACDYCDADMHSKQSMSFQVLANLVKKGLDASNNVLFIWHGGEPLLRKKEFFLRALMLQKRYMTEHHSVANSIQTNGTLLDQDWIDFCKVWNINIGLSIDGPKEAHDSHRRFKNGKGSFSQVLSALRLLKEAEMPHGILSVVTPHTLTLGAGSLFDFYVDSGITNVGVLTQQPANVAQEDTKVLREAYAEFMKELFDAWLEHDDPSITIREFKAIINALLGFRQGACTIGGNCIGKYLGVDTDGNVYHCDEFMFDPDYNLGSIVNTDFEQIVLGERLQNLQSKNRKSMNMLSCNWLPICGGGCPKDRYVARLFGASSKCCGFAPIIEHIQLRLAEKSLLPYARCGQ